MEWLEEQRRKHDDLERERLRHVDEHMKLTSIYYQRMQGKATYTRADNGSAGQWVMGQM